MKQVNKRHRLNDNYLLTGKLFCGECGGHMVGICGTSKNGSTYSYYSCTNQREYRTCNKKAVRKDGIEESIASAIRDYILY